MMEKSIHKNLINNADTQLPNICYSISLLTSEVIIIKRGDKEFYRTVFDVAGEKAEKIVRHCNEKLSVTPEQREALEICSAFHW